ncbi:putative di- and tripeptidase DUG2 [Vanrija pseudolonga]|uniref:Di- and tripeptidase DUG2 n=1 Tax=Vanrija pseudolonga TaxID=143232 RepID=A0AAF0Y932_9TREE|nr:putative di- and tripeptidase DUG2 [Vanrija pseudolonga]
MVNLGPYALPPANGADANGHVPTDSLTRQRIGTTPTLSHLLNVGHGRVLSLAADDDHVYAGCQSRDNEITVFSRTNFQPLFRLIGHAGSVLALLIVKEKGWLVSTSSAGDVRIWCTSTFEPLYIIHPCDDTSGDIYSLAWDDREGGTLYFGAQNTTIEWINFANPPRVVGVASSSTAGGAAVVASAAVLATVDSPASSILQLEKDSPSVAASTPGQRTGRYKPHSFFDKPPADVKSGTSTPHTPGCHPVGTPGRNGVSAAAVAGRLNGAVSPTVIEYEIDGDTTLFYAHYGYVYALTVIPRPDGSKWLASGSGDSDVKIWECAPGGGLHLVREFSGLSGAVLSLAFRDSLLFAGLQGGEIDVWDLETGARIRRIEAHEADVMTMTVLQCDLYAGAADGRVLRIDDKFDCTAVFKAHSDMVLASTIVPGQRKGWEYITAGNDSGVKIWNISDPVKPSHDTDIDVDIEGGADVMLYALSKLVAVPTVSDDEHRESCRLGAHLLKKILGQLGAQSDILPGDPGRNPLVLATFAGRETGKPRKRVLFYGHYDVQPASEKDWEANPWEMIGKNGYLYGRGVTDNKGPIMAIACAAATLRQRRELDVDVVMLIEGEEEAGSRGFVPAVRRHKDLIGHVDVVLLSNSTWINEEDPCVVYGMRGVVYTNISVSSAGDDAHNGVEGGAVAEPMFDLVRVLGSIADAEGIKLPKFYDSVRRKTKEELQLLDEVAKASNRQVDDLMRVWRQPSFSIANITASGGANKTVIPSRVSADVTMRIVPDQELDVIIEGLRSFCHDTFAALNSPNQLEVSVTHAASWWLASLDSPYFKELEAAVHDVWGVHPLKIREGGTVPTMSWLEREFGAPCVHLPLGQSSDAGHLANERMRLLNLRNGKKVFETYLTRLATI